jgi:kumamolisin
VAVNHGANSPTGNPNGPDGQVMLDIEVAGAIAPAANVVVYFAPNTEAGFQDAVSTAINDPANHPSVISISWGGPEGTWTPQARTALDNALKQAASRAITVVAAAGDAGATDGVSDGRPHVGFPASSPWVLAVGGTSLSGAGTSIASEVVWNGGRNGGATGGGVSEVFVLPDWQADAKVPRRQDKTAGRGIPDVAASADPRAGYRVRIDGQESVLGGTAAAAPLWAGLIAILNQGIGKNLGYINPLLYRSIGPQSVLRPIVQGNNSSPAVPGYSAAPGWNAVAGWGTPDGRKLLDWLRAHRTEL